MSNLQKVFAALKKLASGQEMEAAAERAKLLATQVDVDRYSPSALARAVAMRPAAQRGFSESLVSTKEPFATTLIRPSQWAEHTPPLDSVRDANIIEYLKKSIGEKRLQDLPIMWVNDRPSGLEAGYEGRHRMRALKEMYGDDPVPVNMLPGQKYEMRPLTWPPKFAGTLEEQVVDNNQLSPLEMLKRQILMGDKPIDVKPLWYKE